MEAPHRTVFRVVGVLALCTIVLRSAVKADDWNSKVGASDSWTRHLTTSQEGVDSTFLKAFCYNDPRQAVSSVCKLA